MNWQKTFPVLFGFVLLLSIALRLPALDLRPMHGDEAVNAVKFGMLLEHGTYDYNPLEYHGPTLYFFTLISSFPQSITSLSDLNEADLRFIPVLFGLLLLSALFLLKKDISGSVLIFALLFLAISPANVFYNRYYIHESLLVFFSTGLLLSALACLKKKTTTALAMTGIFLGLMISTKETWVVYFAAMLAGFFVSPGIKTIRPLLTAKVFLIAGGMMLLVCVLFYTSFLQNPAGIIDAALSYKNYFSKGATNEMHRHAWDYYLFLLLFFKNSPTRFWTEGLMVLLALAGMFFSLRDKKNTSAEMVIVRFTTVYTLCLIVFFSIIPYKTPWNLLGFLPGLAILAGYGIVRLYHQLFKPGLRIFFLVALSAGFIHLFWQSVQLNFVYPADPSNPWVYAHPLPDVFEIEQKTREITDHHPLGRDLNIQIVAEGHDYWPLPWYFRKYKRVGWWAELPAAGEIAPLIILNANLEPQLVDKLYNQRPPGQRDLYVPLFDHDIFLRPAVEFRAYIKKEDWDLAHRSDESLLLK